MAHITKVPNSDDHRPETISEVGGVIRQMAHWEMMDGTDAAILTAAADLLEDWADEKRGVDFVPLPNMDGTVVPRLKDFKPASY